MAVVQQDRQAPITARLNPFVFPADSILRFALLIVAVTAASLFAFNWLHSVLNQANQSEIVQCQLAAITANPVDSELLKSDPEQYRLTGRSASRPLLLAAGLAAGMAVGAFISFDAAVPLVGPGEMVPAPLKRGLDALFFVAWFVLVFAVLYVFVRWIQSSAEMWLPTVTKYRSLQYALRLDLSIIGILLIFWVGMLFMSYSLGARGFTVVLGAVRSGYTGNAIELAAPLVIVSSILLWGLPLLAALNRKHEVSHAPRWAFLGTPAAAPVDWSTSSSRVPSSFAMFAGLIGGLIAVVLLVSLSIGKSLFVSETVQENGQFLEFYWYMRLSFAILFQAALAGIIAAIVPSSGWIYGLCAAFFAGVLITLGLLGLSVLNGGVLSPELGWTAYAQVATWSAMLAVPVTLTCSLFGAVKRRRIAYPRP